MQSKIIPIYKSGVHNLLDPEIIPLDAASDSKNWITKDGRIMLSNGKVVEGANGSTGAIYGEIFGFKSNGDKVHYRKAGTKIQYLSGSTWTDIITGLTSTADYTFTNYSSLAGSFTFAIGVDGIYKMNNANPGSYISLYDSTKNFKGYAFIDKGRMILWNRPEDKTGLYGSKIDSQNTNYTTVSAETLGTGDGSDLTFSGTLSFKSTATRNCFNFRPYVVSGETFIDNYDGTVTGSLGATGTINYTTGVWTLTFTVAPAASANNIKANYQYEDSNAGGVTDFTKASPRVAGEGFVFPQDEGGDPIINVQVEDGKYYSMKENSAYVLTISDDDTTATNSVYRKDIGVPSLRGALATSKGIIFINVANPEKPEMTILKRNLTGDNLEPVSLFGHFKFANYFYNDCAIETWDRYVLVACRTPDSITNNVILLCDVENKTVDITYHYGRTFAKDGGYMFMGSSISESVYKLFDGYDDEGFVIDNYWIGKDENLQSGENLNKILKIRLKGRITPDQSYKVFANYDNSGAEWVGTVVGSGSYVDYSSPQTIGSNLIGAAQIGGDQTTNVYPYYMEIKLRKVPKFKLVKLSYMAQGFGYVDISQSVYYDIERFDAKLPTRFRLKQNVSIDGTVVDQANP